MNNVVVEIYRRPGTGQKDRPMEFRQSYCYGIDRRQKQACHAPESRQESAVFHWPEKKLR